jgi:hypothetical protein
MGGLIGKLNDFDKVAINVFTISNYIRRMSMVNRDRAFREHIISEIRREEDREFCAKYKIEQINLGLPEFLPENHSYTEFNGNIGEKIKNHIDFSEKSIVFSPLGIGEHANHRQVFDICRLLMENGAAGEFIFYEDLPYGHRLSTRFRGINKLSDFLSRHSFTNYLNILSKKDIQRKREDIMIYESQHVYKCPTRVKMHRYFTRVSLLRHPYEGFWIRSGCNEISKFLSKNPHSLFSILRKLF